MFTTLIIGGILCFALCAINGFLFYKACKKKKAFVINLNLIATLFNMFVTFYILWLVIAK